MTDDHTHDTSDETTSAAPRIAFKKSTIVIPRAQFDTIPEKRARYIFSYAAIILFLIVPRTFGAFGVVLPQPVLLATDIGAAACYFLFFYNFIGAMRIMGYEAWVILVSSLASVFPVPGALLVAYMDRRIAVAWDSVNPEGGYRQKPPPDES